VSTTVHAPPSFTSTLPGRYYYDPSLYELEQARIFGSMWVCAGRQDWEVCELTQQGVTSKAFHSGGIYVPMEHHIRIFADFVLAKLS